MASMSMAQAVMEHAQEFYNISTWYVVAECWDELSVLDELDRVEDETQVPFVLDVGAIAHFAKLVEIKRLMR